MHKIRMVVLVFCAYAKIFALDISPDDDTKENTDIIECIQLKAIPGVVTMDNTGENCLCLSANQQYDIMVPFIQNPKDLNYPCSPVMLEYFKKKREQKEAQCKQFKKRLEC